MAKKRKNDDSRDFGKKLFWYLAAAYVADAVGLLDPKKAGKLSSLEGLAGPATWQEHVRMGLEVDDTFVKKVYALCKKRKNEMQSIGFILRGLGCPCVEERLEELFG